MAQVDKGMTGTSPVDTIVEGTYAGFMNLQVPPEAKLARLAEESGRTADQVALDLLTSSVDHDEWFRAEVEKGGAAARDGSENGPYVASATALMLPIVSRRAR
jgi:hypothetical protein